MDALIDETEAALVEVQPNREATFTDAVAEWREWAEHTKRLKPATLRNYDAMLSQPGARPRHGGPRFARIMRAFGDRRIAEITAADVERFLRRLDREGLAARNVNSHRQALANVFEYACRADTFALPSNPVRGVEKRREDYTKPPDTFTAEDDPRARPGRSRGPACERRPPMGEQGEGRPAGARERTGRRALHRRGFHRPAPRRAPRASLEARSFRRPYPGGGCGHLSRTRLDAPSPASGARSR